MRWLYAIRDGHTEDVQRKSRAQHELVSLEIHGTLAFDGHRECY
jgi:hypothetical protein